MTLIQASNTIISYEGRLKAAVEAIFSQVVYSGTRTNYANHNADLILCIYEKGEWREALLGYWMVKCLITAKAEGKKAMCATCKDALNAMNRNFDNCHIILENMTFNVFSHYMSMKKVRTQECIYLLPDMEVSIVH